MTEEQKREDKRRQEEERRRREQRAAADERARQEARRQEQSRTQGGGSEEISEGTARTLSRRSGYTESQEQTIQTARERGVPIAPVAGLKRESGEGREAGSPLQGEKSEQEQTPVQKSAKAQDSPAVSRLKSKMDGMQDKIQNHIKAQEQSHEQGHER